MVLISSSSSHLLHSTTVELQINPYRLCDLAVLLFLEYCWACKKQIQKLLPGVSNYRSCIYPLVFERPLSHSTSSAVLLLIYGFTPICILPFSPGLTHCSLYHSTFLHYIPEGYVCIELFYNFKFLKIFLYTAFGTLIGWKDGIKSFK